ncbi:MAG: hypothetical protein HOL31_16885 [Candidatus Scalindua sp.]|jgi:signal transduction histidine kinase|nr:hypothetical protein [Candidatus Scalindua sp.]
MPEVKIAAEELRVFEPPGTWTSQLANNEPVCQDKQVVWINNVHNIAKESYNVTNIEKDNDTCQKKLGQILVEDGTVKDADIQTALSLQKNSEHQLLGAILMAAELITREELFAALNKQIELSKHEKKSGVDMSDDERIRIIISKYKGTEPFNDLHELISIVTHKVRNPLAGISAAVEVLKERVGKDDSNEVFFEMISKEIDRLGSMVKDLFKEFQANKK